MTNEDDFISHIEDTLHAYEDAYVPGAWEAFQQKRKRRRMALLFFRAGSAAAVLLLLTYGIVWFTIKPDGSAQLTQTKNILRQSVPKTLQSGAEKLAKDSPVIINDDHNGSITAARRDVAKPGQTLAKHDFSKPEKHLAGYAPVNRPTINGINAAAIVAVKPVEVYKPSGRSAITDTARAAKLPVIVPQNDVIANNNETEKYRQDNKPVYDMLVKKKTGQQMVSTTRTKIKSLSYGVVVSPALGNQKVNFGTGIQVSYNLNNNLSISSGVAYSLLNATTTGNNQDADPTRKVQGVDLAVSGFEVPIGLQYKTNSGFYVSAGVVGMSVTNNHLNYNYLAESTITTLAPNSAGLAQPVMRVVSEQKTEESKEKINNYMGFYILSIGKKKAIGRNQINFGPFLRVPFGTVSTEKINLMQGGVHLGFEF
ncbi:outer membrane beta-barrel protein [Mucilaginibacter sp. UR6-11]|uniref:outer membrane beta-barrel protein n=1 Tax=Mucilaginibacter sp. UR6-11 TaxID=1435644 RepID=UPI001E575138|nr:outer membrane beta-barrel protein [Mucilaginibacter sp. UR6-11]MCC8423865.1 outer membrane beta-barrel protein [Mucilaginibacter sp. UR6-11]